MYGLVKSHRHAAEIKRSRFIAVAVRAESPGAALEQLEAVRDPGATHNCWAYKIGDQYRFSDDGEPAGTAGRPILGAITAQAFDNVLVVVTRHFGGIKLGAGGLARAYGGVAAECLRTAEKREESPKRRLTVSAPFECVGAVHALLEPFACRKLSEEYRDDGLVLAVEIEEAAARGFEKALGDATRGKAVVGEQEAV